MCGAECSARDAASRGELRPGAASARVRDPEMRSVEFYVPGGRLISALGPGLPAYSAWPLCRGGLTFWRRLGEVSVRRVRAIRARFAARADVRQRRQVQYGIAHHDELDRHGTGRTKLGVPAIAEAVLWPEKALERLMDLGVELIGLLGRHVQPGGRRAVVEVVCPGWYRGGPPNRRRAGLSGRTAGEVGGSGELQRALGRSAGIML